MDPRLERTATDAIPSHEVQAQILALLQREGPLVRVHLALKLELNDRRILKELQALRAEGLVVPRKAAWGTKWALRSGK